MQLLLQRKGGFYMFRQLYVYLVLFATLMLTIAGGIGVIMNVADLISPPVYYQSFEDYKAMRTEGELKFQTTEDDSKAPTTGEITQENNSVKLSSSEIRKDYEAMIKTEQERAKSDAKRGIVKSLGFIIIPFPVFLYFNRLRKTKED